MSVSPISKVLCLSYKTCDFDKVHHHHHHYPIDGNQLSEKQSINQYQLVKLIHIDCYQSIAVQSIVTQTHSAIAIG